MKTHRNDMPTSRSMVCDVQDGDRVLLRGDPVADPSGDDDMLTEPLLVHEAYAGRPRADHVIDGRGYAYAGDPIGSDPTAGFTLLAAEPRMQRGIVVHFGDEAHQVAVLDDPED